MLSKLRYILFIVAFYSDHANRTCLFENQYSRALLTNCVHSKKKLRNANEWYFAYFVALKIPLQSIFEDLWQTFYISPVNKMQSMLRNEMHSTEKWIQSLNFHTQWSKLCCDFSCLLHKKSSAVKRFEICFHPIRVNSNLIHCC